MLIEEKVFFDVGDLMIEGKLAYDEASAGAAGAIICPPHPQLGGNMENNIVGAISDSATAEKFVSLRFNYRGAGQGRDKAGADTENMKAFWENSRSPLDELRVQDAFGAVDFLKGVQGVSQDHVFLVGYSFGAYIAQQAAVKYSHIRGLVLIAPTIHFHDFTPLNRMAVPKMVLGSDNDFSYSKEELELVYGAFCAPKSLQLLSGADHFFVGREQEVGACVTAFMLNLCDPRTISG